MYCKNPGYAVNSFLRSITDTKSAYNDAFILMGNVWLGSEGLEKSKGKLKKVIFLLNVGYLYFLKKAYKNFLFSHIFGCSFLHDRRAIS